MLPSFSKNDYSLLLESSYYLSTKLDTHQVFTARGQEFNALVELVSLEGAMLKLASDQKDKLDELEHTGLIFDINKQYLYEEAFPLSTFSPYITLFYRTVNSSKELKHSNLEFLGALKNNMLQDSNFKEEIKKKKKAISKNKMSLLRYIESLFEYRSRLLVLRIDFSYEKNNGKHTTVNQEEITLSGWHTNSQKKLEEWSVEVRKQRNQLIKELKKKYKKDLVGYVWKLEYGAEKAFHYHMIFFLDESKHHQDVRIAESIGEMWKDEITNGKGIYWNCNAKKDHYKKNNRIATGKIKHDDQQLRENLNLMASYLTKPDYFVKLTLSDGARTFGKGVKLKKVKSGRPRI